MILLLVACAGAAPDGVHTATAEIARPGEDPLQVRATWPEGEGDLPVIVLSHGMGGSRDGYAPIAQHWAAHGYLVVQPTHPDSLALRSPREKLALLRGREAFVRDPDNLSAWDERPAEVSLVLDTLGKPPGDLAWLARAGLDPSRIDLEHVGIAGHSFGAHTAMLCGGLAVRVVGSKHREPRADAILLMSPQGSGPGVPKEGFAAIDRPTLVVTGSEDRSVRTGQGPEWRLEAWEGLTVPDRWLLWLDGAHHDLGGLSARLPASGDADLLEAVLEVTTTFWDATLRSDPAARRKLDAGETSGPRAHLTPGAGPAPR